MEDELDSTDIEEEDEDMEAMREWGVPDAPLLGFKGREAELRQLDDAFAEHSVVALWGEPGVGKTALGVEYARRRNHSGQIDGPILYSDLGRHKTLACILSELGIFQEIPLEARGTAWQYITEPEKRQEILQLLTGVRCFLIWDHAELLQSAEWTEAERAELHSFLQELTQPGSATKVLMIGQHPDDPLVTGLPQIELNGLDAPERLELASAIITAFRQEPALLQDPGMAKLLDYVKGNPLTLQILSCYWDRREPASLLELLQSYAREHHRYVLDTVLTLFLEHTTPEGKLRFAYLGMCQGAPNSLVQAHLAKRKDIPAELKGLSLEDWQSFHANLQAVGVIRNLGGVRYQTHPYAARFLYEQLQETLGAEFDRFEDKVEESYAHWADFLGDQMRDDPEFDFEVLSTEEYTATSFFKRALERGAYTHAVVFFHAFAHLWAKQNRALEMDRVLAQVDAVREQAGSTAPPELDHLWKTAYAVRMKLAMDQRDFEREREIHNRLIPAFEADGDDGSKAIALYHLGRISHECGQLDEADSWYRQAMTLAMKIEDEDQVARLLRQMGYLARDRRSYDSAEMLFLQALKMQKRLGDIQDQMLLSFELGSIARDRRTYDNASRWYKDCLQLAIAHNENGIIGRTLYQLGNIALLRGSHEEADTYYRQSAHVYAELNDGSGLANALYQVGMVAQEQDDFQEAMTWYPKALDIFQKRQDHKGVARVLHQLGNIAYVHKDLDEAEEHYRFALELMQKQGDEHTMAHTLHQLGIVARDRQKNAEALHYFHQAATIFERFDDVPHLSTTRRVMMDLEG